MLVRLEFISATTRPRPSGLDFRPFLCPEKEKNSNEFNRWVNDKPITRHDIFYLSPRNDIVFPLRRRNDIRCHIVHGNLGKLF